MNQIRPRAVWATAALLGAAAGAPAATIDLTQNQTGTLNGALFQRADFRPAGTGFIDSFVRLQTNNTVEQGYNTSGRPVPFDENTSPNFTRNLTYGQVPTVTFDGTDYKEFMLDINQNNANPLLSLDQIRVFTSTTGSQTTTDLGSLGTERFSLDTGGDNLVLLNANLTSGSGQGDMFLLVPVSAFADTAAGDFVYLFSRFGDNNPNNGGFEEWAVRVVPLPSSAWAGLAGLAVAGVRWGLRRRLPV
jgi:hypothetical protein